MESQRPNGKLNYPHTNKLWFMPRTGVLTFEYKTDLTLIGMSYESKENAQNQGHLGAFFIRFNELGRVSN